MDLVESTIAQFASPALRNAVTASCKESPGLLTNSSAEGIKEQVECIARGEMLRLLPFWIQSRIFRFISVEERARTLELVSGGEKGEPVQGNFNFRLVVLETFKSVKTIEDLGPMCSKLKLLQATGGDLDSLQTRFPKLTVQLDNSELQGFFTVRGKEVLEFVDLSGRTHANIPEGFLPYIVSVRIDLLSIMVINGDNKSVFLLNLVDFSATNCADMLSEHTYAATAVLNGFVYVAGGGSAVEAVAGGDAVDHGERCERYNLATDTWERIAAMNYGRYIGKLVTWNDSLYAVGGEDSSGTVERYDPTRNTWTVVFGENETLETFVPSVLVSEDILYAVIPSQDYSCCSVSKISLQTGEQPEWEKADQGLPELAYQQHTYRLYQNDGRLCLLDAKKIRENSEEPFSIHWKTFMLDPTGWRNGATGTVKCSHKLLPLNRFFPLFL